MGHDAHQTCAKIQGLTDPRSWVGVLIQDPVDPGSSGSWILSTQLFAGSCGSWILFLEKLDPGDPRFAPRKFIGSGGYSTIK